MQQRYSQIPISVWSWGLGKNWYCWMFTTGLYSMGTFPHRAFPSPAPWSGQFHSQLISWLSGSEIDQSRVQGKERLSWEHLIMAPSPLFYLQGSCWLYCLEKRQKDHGVYVKHCPLALPAFKHPWSSWPTRKDCSVLSSTLDKLVGKL